MLYVTIVPLLPTYLWALNGLWTPWNGWLRHEEVDPNLLAFDGFKILYTGMI